MPADRDLRAALESLDGRGYKAYQAIAQTCQFPGFTLALDRVRWETLSERPSGDWAEFRDLEFATALNCWRSLRVVSGTFRNV